LGLHLRAARALGFSPPEVPQRLKLRLGTFINAALKRCSTPPPSKLHVYWTPVENYRVDGFSQLDFDIPPKWREHSRVRRQA
jgi:hypothetical protein